MENSFKIDFDFHLDPSAKVLRLQGIVELRHSSPYYKVSKINKFGHTGGIDLLPDVSIKCILVHGQRRWVHTDSGKESNLSRMAGAAIERVQPDIEIAEDNPTTDDNEEDQ
ncbi:MAG TPA: hypothetical protein VF939_25715 [Puia sp.]